MQYSMYTKPLLFAVCSIIPFALQAAESAVTTCTKEAQTRRIEVRYPQAENSPICEVLYSKNGSSKVLWNAQNDISFCERKAAEFVAKQNSWGWQCQLEQSDDIDAQALQESIEKQHLQANEKRQASQSQVEQQSHALESQVEQQLEAEKADIDAEVKKLKQQQQKAK